MRKADRYKKILLLRCIHHFKSDFISNMDHMRISGNEPSSVIACSFIPINASSRNRKEDEILFIHFQQDFMCLSGIINIVLHGHFRSW